MGTSFSVGMKKGTTFLLDYIKDFQCHCFFGGDGSYMAPFSLHNDNILTSLMGQSVPPYHMVSIGCWVECTIAATTSGYCHYGLVVYALEEESNPATTRRNVDGAVRADEISWVRNIKKEHSSVHPSRRAHLSPSEIIDENYTRRKIGGAVLDLTVCPCLKKREIYFIFSLLYFIIQNPVGHQDLVGLVISILLLGDFSLVLLTLLQCIQFLWWMSSLFCLYYLSAFFSHFLLELMLSSVMGQGVLQALPRVYALWNLTSVINVVSCLYNSSDWWFPLFADIFITTLNRPAKNIPAFNHGVLAWMKVNGGFSQLD
ncbi:uncharacterized protein G2W53_044696 [Senna tora]|uniref:Uncharacterized protein n=1 Tax=Senna tora TaxID=362788 RepID=A0A834SC99_9FABA|nr:uncharacterized protein G2W53_044696 [Senna tora]